MSVLEWLSAQKIPYRILEYPSNIVTPLAAAEYLKIQPEQMLKSLVVKVGADFVMILTPLPKRLNMKVLMSYFDTIKIRMAMAQEALAVTGYKVGTICPFLLKTPMKVYIDEAVTRYEDIALSSGAEGKEMMIKLADLEKAVELTFMVL